MPEAPASIISEPKPSKPLGAFLTPDEVRLIGKYSSVSRSTSPEDFKHEIGLDTPFHRGDYQKTLEDRGLVEGIAVPLPEEIQRYTEELIRQGIPCVNIVDFGAALAKTTVYTADRMKDLIKSGRVNMVATNWQTSPTETDVEDLIANEEKYLGLHPDDFLKVDPDHLKLLKQTIHDKRVNFLRAGTVELFEAMKGKPVHLMFMMDVPTQDFIDIMLKVAAEMLDPDYGTFVFASVGLIDHKILFSDHVPERENLTDTDTVERGRKNLEAKGFKEELVSSGDIFYRFAGPLLEFQGPKAPKFYLYQTQERKKLMQALRPNPLKRFIPAFLRK